MPSPIRRLFGGPRFKIDDSRWVVLDVESSGLDPRRDRLIAMAAIALHVQGPSARIALGDSFEVVLRQSSTTERLDKENILLHGIGVGAQRAGVAPAEGLKRFEAFVGRSPLIAFHAAFDRTLIERGFMAQFGRKLPNPWLDLEPLAEVLQPQVRAKSLDEWMAAFNINCAVRHQAAADTLATAELLLKLWPALRQQCPAPAFAQLADLAASRRWLAP